ncbi:MAG: PD40 domain-containing protein [Planctomycetes bacterium]|nr:PD40 domain-containing protein [Planctomycetota bacterium]
MTPPSRVGLAFALATLVLVGCPGQPTPQGATATPSATPSQSQPPTAKASRPSPPSTPWVEPSQLAGVKRSLASQAPTQGREATARRRVEAAARPAPTLEKRLLASVPPNRVPHAIQFDPSSLSVAFVARKRNGGAEAVVVGEQRGEEFSSVQGLVLGGGGMVAYRTHDNGRARWVLGAETRDLNKKGHSLYGAAWRPAAAFSPQGTAWATCDFDGSGWRVACKGVSGPALAYASTPVFSSDGSRLAYLANVDGKLDVLVGNKVGKGKALISPDDPTDTYVVGGTWHVIEPTQGIVATLQMPKRVHVGVGRRSLLTPPTLSARGESLAWRTQQGKSQRVVLDGKPGEAYDAIGPLVFSPNGKTIAFMAARAKTIFVVKEGLGAAVVKVSEGKSVPRNKNSWRPAFSPDGTRLAYPGPEGMLLDGAGGAPASAKGEVGAPGFSPDGKLVYYRLQTARGDGFVVGSEHVQLGPRESLVLPLAFEGARVGYVVAAGREIRLEVMSLGGLPKRVLEHGRANDDTVRFALHSPDGALLAVGTRRDVRVWDLRTGELAWRSGKLLATPLQIAFSADGRKIAFGGKEGGVSIRRSSDGKEVQQLESGLVTKLRFTSKGLLVCERTPGPSRPGRATLYTIRNGDPKASVPSDPAEGPAAPTPAEGGPQLGAAAGASAHTLAVAFSRDEVIGVGASGPRNLTSGATLKGPSLDRGPLALSPGGRYVAWCDTAKEPQLQVWDLTRKRAVRVKSLAGWEAPPALAINRRGTRVLTRSTRGLVSYWDFKKGKRLKPKTRGFRNALAIGFGRKDRPLAVGRIAKVRTTALFDLDTGKTLFVLPAPLEEFKNETVIAFGGRGKRAAIADGLSAFHVLDLKKGVLIKTVTLRSRIAGIAFDEAGKRVACAMLGQGIEVVDLEAGEPAGGAKTSPSPAASPRPADPKPVDAGSLVGPVSEPPGTIYGEIVPSQSGTRGAALTASAGRPVLTVWDLERGTRLLTLGPKGQRPMETLEREPLPALSPEGDLVAALTRTSATRAKTLRLWSVPSGRLTASIPLEEGDQLTLPQFSPDGALFAAWLGKGQVVVWSARSGNERYRLDVTRKRSPANLQLSFSGGCVVTNIDDKVARLFAVATGELKRELTPKGPLGGLALAPGGKHVAVCAGSTVRIYPLD